ncbi:MAG TPA: trehalose-phosphatase [Rhizomicrobium sp.]|jgi:trehalose 6-phosphate phosphatase|nr:trehalose-phosphatase [Rhizomicrobium sp.]
MAPDLSLPPPPLDAFFSLGSDALLLDVDGTIIDIAPTPEAVHVPQSLIHTLRCLQHETGGAIALVSGRKLATLDSLFAPLALAAIGCHGAEWRLQPGHPVEFRARPLPPEIRQTLFSVIAGAPQVRIEDKDYTLAFHYRSAPEVGPELEARLDRAILPFATELRLLRGKCVLEVKPRGFDKGEVIRALMQHPPFAGRRPVFLGDDTTDQDAFTALRELDGIGISIGRPMADAEFMLPDPQAARDWLAALARRIERRL